MSGLFVILARQCRELCGPCRRYRTTPVRFEADLEAILLVLHRHLTDEEELVVPVILKHGPDALA